MASTNLDTDIEPAISRAEYARSSFDPAEPPIYEDVLRHLKHCTSDKARTLLESEIYSKRFLVGGVSLKSNRSLFSRRSFSEKFENISSKLRNPSDNLEKVPNAGKNTQEDVAVNASLIAVPATEDAGPGQYI